MKKLLATTVVAASVASGALAADLPSRKAPLIAPPPPVFTWTGFYIGLNAGLTYAGNNNGFVASAPYFSNPAFGGILNVLAPNLGGAIANSQTGVVNLGNGAGAVLGGQVGYNWQFGSSFLLGLETDIQGVVAGNPRATFSGIGSTAFLPALLGNTFPIAASSVGTVRRATDWLGTVRGRLGYTVFPNFLVYATGGLAYGGVKSNTGIATSVSHAVPLVGPVNTTFAQGSYSQTRVGYTVGGGVEWMFMPNWSVKAEYLYYNLGTANYGVNGFAATNALADAFGVSPLVATTSRTRIRYDGHIARAGVNFHFWGSSAPVVARY